MTPDRLQVTRNPVDAFLDFPAIRFQLRFTFTTAHADAAFLSRQVAPEASQSWEQVLQLREFDLEFAFPRAGSLSKDVENERRAIQDFAIENFFEVTALRG